MVGDRAGARTWHERHRRQQQEVQPAAAPRRPGGERGLRKIELLLLEGEEFRTVVLDYADGPRYLVMVRDESKPDLLAEILKPMTGRPASTEPRPADGRQLEDKPRACTPGRPAVASHRSRLTGLAVCHGRGVPIIGPLNR